MWRLYTSTKNLKRSFFIEYRIEELMELLKASLNEYQSETGDVITIMDQQYCIRVSPHHITLENALFTRNISKRN